MEILSAKEANALTAEAEVTRRYSDISKMATIMKNIKTRIKNGFYYYDYQPSVSYAMAKTLIENGYQLKSATRYHELKLEDFKEKSCYQVRISWGEVQE